MIRRGTLMVDQYNAYLRDVVKIHGADEFTAEDNPVQIVGESRLGGYEVLTARKHPYYNIPRRFVVNIRQIDEETGEVLP